MKILLKRTSLVVALFIAFCSVPYTAAEGLPVSSEQCDMSAYEDCSSSSEEEVTEAPKVAVNSPEKEYPVTYSDPEGAYVGGTETVQEEQSAPTPSIESQQAVVEPRPTQTLANVQEAPHTVLAANTTKQPTADTATPEVNQLIDDHKQQQAGGGSIIYAIAVIGTLVGVILIYYFLKSR